MTSWSQYSPGIEGISMALKTQEFAASKEVKDLATRLDSFGLK